MRYLEIIPSEMAIHLEDPLRVPSGGWTQTTLEKAAKDYVSLQKVYRDNTAGGLPKSQRQRAVWANDRRMMSTPLGLTPSVPPKAAQPSAGEGGTCTRCGGNGHMKEQCFNSIAAKDPKWAAKSKEQKENSGEKGSKMNENQGELDDKLDSSNDDGSHNLNLIA